MDSSGPLEDREAALDQWEKQTFGSLIATERNKRASGIAIAAVAAVALGAALYIKSGASAEEKPAAGTELSIAERKPVPKLKNAAAADQASAPAAAPGPTPASTAAADEPTRVQRDLLEAQHREQERRLLDARLKSALIAPNAAAPSPSPMIDGPNQEASPPREPAGLAVAGERGAQDPNSRFARAVSGGEVATNQASRIDHLDYKILQGKLLEAVLEPRAVSDLPGTVCAVVQRDVYGAQGRVALVPWGSRVCGVYSAEMRKGQDRLFAVWNTVRRPDGVQVTLDSIGADQLGSAGMGGLVDTHFAQIFGVSALLSIIGAGAANAGVSSGDQYNSAAAYRQSVQQAAAQTSQQALQPSLNIPPTVTVPAGARIRIYVNRDLDFTPIYRAEIDAARDDGVTVLR